MLAIMQAFVQKGYRCIVVLPEKGPLSEKARASSIETRFFPIGYYGIVKKSVIEYLLYGLRLPLLLFKLIHLLKKENVGLVYANGARTFPWVTLACRLLGVPLYWHVHSIFDRGMSRKACLFFGRSKAVKKIITVSRAVAAPLYPLRGKIEIIYNAVPAVDVLPGENLLKKEYRLPREAFLIGTAAILEEWKNQEDLVKAAQLIRGSGVQNAYFFLIGDSLYRDESRQEYKQRLKDLVRACGLEKEVIFTGFRNDIRDVVAALDVVVVSSKTPDPCPLASLEAAALGVPLISADAGGTREIFVENQEALFYRAGDPGALAEKISFLIGNREAAHSIGERARTKVRRDFNIEDYLKRIIFLVEDSAYAD